MAQQRRVLLYGRDRTLIDLRGKVLSSSGFVTKATDERDEALGQVHDGMFDLLILCQTLSDKECVDVLQAAKDHPAMKRLVLTHGFRNLPRAMFDGECNPLDGPECLIRLTSQLLNVAPQIATNVRRREA